MEQKNIGVTEFLVNRLVIFTFLLAICFQGNSQFVNYPEYVLQIGKTNSNQFDTCFINEASIEFKGYLFKLRKRPFSFQLIYNDTFIINEFNGEIYGDSSNIFISNKSELFSIKKNKIQKFKISPSFEIIGVKKGVVYFSSGELLTFFNNDTIIPNSLLYLENGIFNLVNSDCKTLKSNLYKTKIFAEKYIFISDNYKIIKSLNGCKNTYVIKDRNKLKLKTHIKLNHKNFHEINELLYYFDELEKKIYIVKKQKFKLLAKMPNSTEDIYDFTFSNENLIILSKSNNFDREKGFIANGFCYSFKNKKFNPIFLVAESPRTSPYDK